MRTAVAITFVAAVASSCLTPVLERQCERDVDCGSGFKCIAATCMSVTSGDAGRAGGGGTAGGNPGGGPNGGGAPGGGGGTTTLCGPGTCNGCCNAVTNICVPTPNQSTTVCGAAGRQCLACPSNDMCKDGTCVGPAACDFETCSTGCCVGNMCVMPASQSSVQCGVGGGLCRACPAGGVCNMGTCQTTPMCNAASCPSGCCNGNACIPFSAQNVAACGLGGQACRACGANQTCITGSCAATLCNPTNCPNGCCQGNVCVQPASQSAANCGRFGQACQACASGQTCSSGACVAQGCGPQTCMGCCSLGSCTRGFDNFACGAGGQQCVQCPAGSNCTNGVCQGCGPTTCPGGCCQSNFCQPGNLGSACGSMGTVCQSCPAGMMCQLQRCVPVTPVTVGSPCTTDPDCAGLGMGAICKRFTSTFNAVYQGGYCTLRCAGAGGPCPMGSSCLSAPPVGENDSICLQNCGTMNPCRMPGYACYNFTAVLGACWIFPTPPALDGGFPPADAGRAVGQPCVTDNQCQPPANAFCLPPTFAGLNTGYVGGYCSRDCAATGACPGGSVCITETFPGGGTFMSCKTVCGTPGLGQGSCRPSYLCLANAAGSAWCGPRCNNQSLMCPNGGMCNNATGYCQ